MAETLISPGVLARENDQSQITSQPIQAGAAIVGPTVLGKKGIPRLVTSYSEYLANFGSTFSSASDEYSFLTSISAFNYFQKLKQHHFKQVLTILLAQQLQLQGVEQQEFTMEFKFLKIQ